MKFLFGNRLIKAKIKGHYRKLPNGRLIFIEEHRDKRKEAQKKPENFKHTYAHADEHSTSVVGHDDKIHTYKHNPQQELKEEDIHAHLGRTIPIDMKLAEKLYQAKLKDEYLDVTSYPQLYKNMVEEEKLDAKSENRKPKFSNIEDAKKFFEKNVLKKYLDNLKETYGDATNLADAYEQDVSGHEEDQHFKKYGEHESLKGNGDYHAIAEHKMAMDYHSSAIKQREEEKKEIKESQKLSPKDMKKIPALASNLKVFGHQAEVLAKLNVMKKAIVDVDMGGGKGLLLPLDAINLMAQGKVKKPLIVAPANTLLQNSRKIHEYTDGKINTFMISNDIINDVYDGNIQKLVEDINNAPPNTIFMATYSVFAYSDKNHYRNKNIPSEKQVPFGRGFEISAMGADYVALDECFHPDTLIKTKFGEKRVFEIKEGDFVLSALGWKPVTGTRSKKLDKHIRLRFNGKEIKCSENHVWFTPGGWVRAKDLKIGDLLVKTTEAMRMVREGFPMGTEKSFLQSILFSEVENEQVGVQGENLHTGTCKKNIGEVKGNKTPVSQRAYVEKQSNVLSEKLRQNEGDTKKNWTQAADSGWQRTGTDGTGSYAYTRVGRWMGVEFSHLHWKTASGRTNVLQTRLGTPSAEDSDRMRRLLTPVALSASPRFKEDENIDGFRLESVEIQESGSDERNPDGLFYDLQVDGHPSFTVNEVLTHNSQRIKDPNTNTHKAMQYLSGAKYKRVATGTFISNDPFDALGQLRWLDPSFKINKEKFAERYGFQENDIGRKWDDESLQKLRNELTDDYGMISLRRSAWLHKLPKRVENLHKLEASPKIALANESAISDSMSMLEEIANANPKIREQLNSLGNDSDDDDDLGESGMVGQVLEAMRGITDHPHEMAERMELGISLTKKYKKQIDAAMSQVDLEQEKNAGSDRRGFKKEMADAERELKALDLVIHANDIDSEDASAMRYTVYFQAGTQKHIINMKNEVSPKAKKTYDVIREHLKNPKNGKFIVFAERIRSVDHIFNNMPEDLKKQAVYYSGDRRTGLAGFLKEGGPKIIVACDPSLAEGVNMQIANGMVRYDLPYTSGKAEQTYGRIWRFGQDKEANIHIPLTNNSLDVVKYCRLMSKLKTNYKIISGYDLSPNTEAYKLNTSNIRKYRDFDELVPQYNQVQKEIEQQETKANVGQKERFGSEMLDPKSGGEIKGSQPPPAGHGAYFNDGSSFKGGVNEALSYLEGQHGVTGVDKELRKHAYNDVIDLYDHLEAKGIKLKHTKFGEVESLKETEQFWKEWEKDADGTASDKQRAIVGGAVALLQQQESPGEQKQEIAPKQNKKEPQPKVSTPAKQEKVRSHKEALEEHLKSVGKHKIPAEGKKLLLNDIEELKGHLGNKSLDDKAHVQKYWDSWAKEAGEKASNGHRKAVEESLRNSLPAKKLKKALIFVYRDTL